MLKKSDWAMMYISSVSLFSVLTLSSLCCYRCYLFFSRIVIMFSLFFHIRRVTTVRVVGDLCCSPSPSSSSATTTEDRATASHLVHRTHYGILQTSLGTICSNIFTYRPGNQEDGTSGWRWYTTLFTGLDGSSSLKDSITNRRNFFLSNGSLSEIMSVVIDDDMANIVLSIGILSALFVPVMMHILEGYYDLYILITVFLGYTMSMTVYGIIATTINTMLICYYRYPNEFEMYQPQLFARISDAIRLYPTTTY
jgi:hypothetical protein